MIGRSFASSSAFFKRFDGAFSPPSRSSSGNSIAMIEVDEAV